MGLVRYLMITEACIGCCSCHHMQACGSCPWKDLLTIGRLLSTLGVQPRSGR